MSHNPSKGGGERGGDSDIDVNTLFTLLVNQPRRYALYAMAESPESVIEVDVLVDTIIAQAPESADPDREAIATELSRRHLPRLAEADVIEYDELNETVRYRGSHQLEQVLDFAAELEREVPLDRE